MCIAFIVSFREPYKTYILMLILPMRKIEVQGNLVVLFDITERIKAETVPGTDKKLYQFHRFARMRICIILYDVIWYLAKQEIFVSPSSSYLST